MDPQKLRESQLWEFRDSHLGVTKKNAIRMLVPWLGIEYSIRGKVVASSNPSRGESCESKFARGSS
jgi:hypothetical protein